jgi:hypothetical protein
VRAIDVTAYAVAIGLASVAALFSVKGMLHLFPGAPILIVAMASMMEAGKLLTAAWLASRWRVTPWLSRLVLVALVAGLAVINTAIESQRKARMVLASERNEAAGTLRRPRRQNALRWLLKGARPRPRRHRSGMSPRSLALPIKRRQSDG